MLVYKLYRRFVILVDKIADQNLPGYQPRKFIDTGYVKDLSSQHRKLRCLHFVTVAVMLLQLIYYNAYCNIAPLRKRLRIRSVISVNYHYITVYAHLTY